jgi:hypothetical protein
MGVYNMVVWHKESIPTGIGTFKHSLDQFVMIYICDLLYERAIKNQSEMRLLTLSLH